MFSRYKDVTTIHPFALVAVVILGLLILFAPRRYVSVFMLITACFISAAQRIVVLGLDFQILRILILFTWARIFLKQELFGFKWKRIDSVFCAWQICKSIIYVIQWGPSAIEFCSGTMFTYLGFYFGFRILIRSADEIKTFARGVALVSIPVVICFIIENRTGRNLFSFLGGVPAFTAVREGRLRCQGAFPHAIMAGNFWAGLLPLVVSLFFIDKKDKILGVIGSLCCLVIVIACASSTPILGVVAGIGISFLWVARRKLPLMSWLFAGGILFLHMIMEGPVWSLIGRVSAVGGSTGWHRVRLITGAVNNFWQWAFFGTKSTGNWGYHLFDVTNQYILEGVRGGFLTFSLFLCLLWLAFRGTYLYMNEVRGTSEEKIAWGIWVAMFVHCAMFVAVSYFGQIEFLLNLQLAIMATLYPVKGVKPAVDKTAGSESPSEDQVAGSFNHPWKENGLSQEKQPWHS